MIIYGYTRVTTKDDENGKESETFLFTDYRKERDRVMYQDYSDSFDSMTEECDFDRDPDTGILHDEDGKEKLTEEEFLKELTACRDESRNIFGLIVSPFYHVQFEPFIKVI